MGCKSSTPAKSTSQQEPAQAQAVTLTQETTSEEKVFTQCKLIFDSIASIASDHAVSKEALSAALKRDEGLGALIKDAGLNVKYDLLGELVTQQEGISWEEFWGHLKERVDEVVAKDEVAVVALPATEKAIDQLKVVFNSIDTDGDDAVSKEELAAKLKEDTDEDGKMKEGSFGKLVADAGFNPNFFVFDQLDTKKDGRITWDEFEQNLRLVEAAVEEKETGDLSAAVAVQEAGESKVDVAVHEASATRELDDPPAPICGCSVRGVVGF